MIHAYENHTLMCCATRKLHMKSAVSFSIISSRTYIRAMHWFLKYFSLQDMSTYYLRVYILMFYVFAKPFHIKPIFLYHVKKFAAKNKLSNEHFLSFLTHYTKRCRFPQNLAFTIECQHVGAESLFRFFLIL
jgi:hypothetical protein